VTDGFKGHAVSIMAANSIVQPYNVTLPCS
jgi:hypothetical protein